MRAEMDTVGSNPGRGAAGGGASGKGKGGPGALRAVHLLSADEVRSLFRDVVEGLAFLVSLEIIHRLISTSIQIWQHDKSILHLDLKPGNVLLTWDEGNLMCAFGYMFLSTL